MAERQDLLSKLQQALEQLGLIPNASQNVRQGFMQDAQEAVSRILPGSMEQTSNSRMELYTIGRAVVSANWQAGKFYVEFL